MKNKICIFLMADLFIIQYVCSSVIEERRPPWTAIIKARAKFDCDSRGND